ncbi:anti-sigma factor [Candidatus Poriferisocius sp.]|uniref:anti-sigma factor n=1 Tax=Candidatus Poriferisocius sp. TaxID=3101276 RepID=UPI003B51AEFB
MDEERTGRTDSDIDAMLRDLDASELELISPPEDVWEGIESAVQAGADAPGAVVSLEFRRRKARRIMLSAAAALVLVAGGIAAAVTLTGDDPARVIASAELAYDPDGFDELGAFARAGAELIAEDDGHSIEIVDASLPSPEAGADLEAWLIQPDEEGNVADLVSIGLVDPEEPGRLEVPAGYDPQAFFVLDISIEPRDGEAGHSGRSILRGPLREL